MRASPGDRIVIKRLTPRAPVRDGEILETHGSDGEPPYLVQWSDDGCIGLVFPGPDAFIEQFSTLARSARAKEEP